MCGIAGIIHWRASLPPVEEKALLAMRDTMVHRGPDDAGFWFSKDRRVGLAHRRLSIVDLSAAAHQPMCNEAGDVWVTFNGEIYNHPSLRRELESRGHVYRSHSDTESILHAYEEWGRDAVDHLDGMFSFGLWDSRERRLWLVRDRMGKKPLYFADWGGQLVFASEIKALLAHPAARREVCEEALWHYLTYAVAPAPLTMFEGIHKLPPGTHLTIEDGGRQTFTEYGRPWRATDDPPRSFEDYATDLQQRLRDSVERRLMSDVPFGVFLSGGIDSSANVALMSQVMDRPVDTFSVGFEDSAQAPHDEIQHARRIAKLFGTNHREILIADRHFFEFIDRLAYFQDEPLCDPVCFPLYYVSKLARDSGTIVIQVGEGSDELFAGYDIYRNYLARHEGLWKNYAMLPAWLRSSAAAAARPFLSRREAVHLRRAARGEPVFLSAALAFYDEEKSPLRDWKPTEPSWKWCEEAYEGGNPSLSHLSRLCPDASVKPLPPMAQEGTQDFLKRMIHWECHQRLAELLLMRLDKMMMATSVEGRAPFLDTRVVELAMQIPSSMKIRDGVGKAVLKKAVESLLPKDLIDRKKVGFCGGSGNMLTPAILDFAEQTILSQLPARGWRKPEIERWISAHRSGKAENSFQIWNLMNLSLWFKQWF